MLRKMLRSMAVATVYLVVAAGVSAAALGAYWTWCPSGVQAYQRFTDNLEDGESGLDAMLAILAEYPRHCTPYVIYAVQVGSECLGWFQPRNQGKERYFVEPKFALALNLHNGRIAQGRGPRLVAAGQFYPTPSGEILEYDTDSGWHHVEGRRKLLAQSKFHLTPAIRRRPASQPPRRSSSPASRHPSSA